MTLNQKIERAIAKAPLGKIAYDAYCDARDWKSFNGDPLPQFDAQSEGLQWAWHAAAKAAVEAALIKAIPVARYYTTLKVADKLERKIRKVETAP